MRLPFKKVADNINDLRHMETQKLPIPGIDSPDHYLVIMASQKSYGTWQIEGFHTLGENNHPPGFLMLEQAFIKVVQHYHRAAPQRVGKTTQGNFDDAFLILRAMEESVLAYMDRTAGIEPAGHFMSAYRLLPQEDRIRLDGLYFSIQRDKGPVLPPRRPPGMTPPF